MVQTLLCNERFRGRLLKLCCGPQNLAALSWNRVHYNKKGLVTTFDRWFRLLWLESCYAFQKASRLSIAVVNIQTP